MDSTSSYQSSDGSRPLPGVGGGASATPSASEGRHIVAGSAVRVATGSLLLPPGTDVTSPRSRGAPPALAGGGAANADGVHIVVGSEATGGLVQTAASRALPFGEPLPVRPKNPLRPRSVTPSRAFVDASQSGGSGHIVPGSGKSGSAAAMSQGAPLPRPKGGGGGWEL